LANCIKAAFNRQPQAFLGLLRFLGQQAEGGSYIFQPFELDPASFRKRFRDANSKAFKVSAQLFP
jgi:hypothetical protein